MASPRTPIAGNRTIRRFADGDFGYLREKPAANPIFVEDAARLFAEALQADARVGDFRVVASHQESLHSRVRFVERDSDFHRLARFLEAQTGRRLRSR